MTELPRPRIPMQAIEILSLAEAARSGAAAAAEAEALAAAAGDTSGFSERRILLG